MFLIRLVRELAPVTSLELGTGLGISSAYQAAGLELNGRGELTTLEGARAWAEVAEQGLSSLGLAERCRVEVGPIDETLEPVLNRIAPIDYAYLDADHSEEATVKHFEAVLPHMARGGVVVLDDVAFSWDMWQAWTRITAPIGSRSGLRWTGWACSSSTRRGRRAPRPPIRDASRRWGPRPRRTTCPRTKRSRGARCSPASRWWDGCRG